MPCPIGAVCFANLVYRAANPLWPVVLPLPMTMQSCPAVLAWPGHGCRGHHLFIAVK